ncbi:winged helix-turn-helix domain-containing tetratricopeptide repeat protein [Aestuariivirga sp.]|uniref:winged helix-turn-helix domain-containing tetratricopeptide repeat protein n=1 Tax=Aestuariivirga sp. TaxID=2650926 RepID=UPI00391DFD52
MVWTFGAYCIDPDRFELTCGGAPVRLEPQVLALLIHLVRHRERMVSKDEIVAAIWNGGIASDASIASRIRSARQAVGDDGKRQEVVRTIHGRGYRFVAPLHETASVASESEEAPQPQLANAAELTRPSIAVLPFRPLAVAPELAILSHAIPHEIIQALSRLRWLAVIARGSSFRFREPELELVGTALGARYVLSGLIEASGSTVAVTLELADAGRNEVIWGDRLSAPLDGIEDLRKRIVVRVVAALDLHVPENEARGATLRGTERLDAWANFHLGLHQLYRFTADAVLQARQHFERAVAVDPHFARAHAGLSFTSFLEAFLQLGPEAPAAALQSRRHAERAMELDPLDPFTHFNMGRSFWLTAEPEAARGWLQRAVELNPNYAQGFYARAFTSMLTGNAEEVNASLDTALLLSPLDPLLYGMYGVRTLTLLQAGDTRAAARWGDRAASTPGAHHLIAMIAAVANGLDGRRQQAERWSQEARRRKPGADAAQFRAAFPIRDGNARSRIEAELARLGF